jgi:hypothetical protein
MMDMSKKLAQFVREDKTALAESGNVDFPSPELTARLIYSRSIQKQEFSMPRRV